MDEDLLNPSLWNGVGTLSLIKTTPWFQIKDVLNHEHFHGR